MSQPEQAKPDLHSVRLADLGRMTEEEFEAFERNIDLPVPEQDEEDPERWDSMS